MKEIEQLARSNGNTIFCCLCSWKRDCKNPVDMDYHFTKHMQSIHPGYRLSHRKSFVTGERTDLEILNDVEQ